MALRAVVFDLFDTLVDLRFEDVERIEFDGRWLPASVTKLHAAVADHAELEFADFLRELQSVDTAVRALQVEEGREVSTRRRFDELSARLGLDVPGLSDRLTALHMEMIASAVAVPGHHGELLREIGERVRLGVCSNFTHAPTALGVLDGAGLREHFDGIVISESVGWRKPRPEIFAAVLEELAVEPREVLHVGDSLRADVAGAASIGMRTAWVTRRVRDADDRLTEHAGPPPDHRIADLEEISRLLDEDEGR